MAKAPAIQFYVKDWLSDPELRMASHSTKGIWIDMLCYMWESSERGKICGTLEQIKKLVSATDEDMDLFISEAKTLQFCDVTICNKNVTVINRRIHQDYKDKQNTRLRVQRFREKQKSNANVTPSSPSPTPTPTPKIKDIVPYEEIIDYLNEKAGTHFKHKTKTTRGFIKARWNEDPDFSNIGAFRYVIDVKCGQWLNDPKMIGNLRPQTLFGTKFESYLNEVLHE